MTFARLFRLWHGCILSLTLLLAWTATASADRRVVSTGFYAEVGAGATQFLGDASNYSQIGPSFEARTGYELFSWLAIGVSVSASTHEATVPPPPEGEYYQLYGGAGDLRIGFRLGPVAAFADGGVGVGMVSSNILNRVDIVEPNEKFSLMLRAGGGLEYQLVNRHYAFGVAGQWVSLPQFDQTQAVATRLYLRYTY